MTKKNFKNKSFALSECLKELQKCKKEKEEILLWIEQLKEQNKLSLCEKEVRARMNNNVEQFEKVVAKIKELKAE